MIKVLPFVWFLLIGTAFAWVLFGLAPLVGVTFEHFSYWILMLALLAPALGAIFINAYLRSLEALPDLRQHFLIFIIIFMIALFGVMNVFEHALNAQHVFGALIVSDLASYVISFSFKHRKSAPFFNSLFDVKVPLIIWISLFLMLPISMLVLFMVFGDASLISFQWHFPFQMLFIGVFFGALGGELGWRGYLVPALLRYVSPLFIALIIGVIWWVWLIPLEMGGHIDFIALSMVERLILSIAMNIVLTYVFLRTRGSTLITTLMVMVILFILTHISHRAEMLQIFTGFLMIVGVITLADPLMKKKPRARQFLNQSGMYHF